MVLKFQSRGSNTGEETILTELSKAPSADAENIARLLDAFDATGYRCLVLEAMWQPATHLIFSLEWSMQDKMKILKYLTRGVLKGLDFLQRKGVIHNGDR